MHRTRVLVAAVAVTLILAAPAVAATPGQFAGAAEGDLLLVGAQIGAVTEQGSQPIRLYICNSVPDREWFVGAATADHATLESASGDATAEVTIGERELTGTVTLASGATRTFTIPRASGGAGIYAITVTRSGRLAGRSLGGDVFVAQQTGKRVRGHIVTADNQVIPYAAFDLPKLSARKLRKAKLPTRLAGLGGRSNRAGDYVAVAGPVNGGLGFFGVNASLLSGTITSSEIIGIDKMRTSSAFTFNTSIAPFGSAP